MKKTLWASIMLLAASFGVGKAYAADVEYPDRPIYGYFAYNSFYSNDHFYGEYGFASQTFRDLSENALIYPFGNSVGLYAATAIDGVYYGVPYRYTSSLEAPAPLPMFRYNLYTGVYEEIGDWLDKGFDTNFKVTDMTYDRKNDRLLALGYASSTGTRIYEVNRTSGKLTEICPVTIRENGELTPPGVIACDSFGRVFLISTDGILYQFDMASKRPIRLLSTPYKALLANQSMEFDLTNNKLYWASITYDNPNNDRGYATNLIEFTLPTVSPDVNFKPTDKITYRDLGQIGFDGQFSAMYIPYATGGFLAPGFVTETSFTTSADGSSCTISFKAPTKTFGGEELTSLDGFDVYRQGERIGYMSGITPGQPVTYTDNTLPAPGEYRYDIVCYSNINGDGPKNPVFAYAGADQPSAVTDLVAEVGDDFRDVTISWNAPAAGSHGGAYDPSSTTYDIFRHPDNVRVAENLTTTSYKDRLPRLLRYSYEVTARNSIGASKAKTSEFVAGKPLTEFPVDETFDNPTAMLLKWTPVDNNHDGQSWMYGSDYSHSVFGDYEMAANYILSPTSIDPGVGDADDWLISPPVRFGNDDYVAEIEIRSLYPETFKVYVGSRNSTDAMEFIEEIRLREPQYNDGGRMLFNSYFIPLPESVRGKIACVGVQLATPLSATLTSFVQVGAVTIDTASAMAGIENVTCEPAKVSVANGQIHLSGHFTQGALYDLQGMQVCSIVSETTDISALPQGIYVLVIDGQSYKIAR